MTDVPRIHVYNTAAKKLEELRTLKRGEVSMYVCGPTVYDDCHVGHARSMVAFDIVVRWLEYRGFKVRYIRNITDIDDKLIKRAAERGISCRDLAEQYIGSLRGDAGLLFLRKPDVEPRATEHIPEMIALISRLWEKGLAYLSQGDVYFDVQAFPPYGRLSGRRTEDLLAGARVEVSDKKRNPLDFVLWKAAKEGEPQWPSPWGLGRPGWHIECSAMSAKYLGGSFDIHGGGEDLIFPHHENELAQSQGAHGTAPARYWLHNAFVTIDKTKMSKSLGNFFTLKEVFRKYDPCVVRFFLLRTHYRTPVDFSDDALSEAGAALRRIDECAARVEEAMDAEIRPSGECPPDFRAAMDDDFNTTGAIGAIFNLVSRINHRMDVKEPGWREEAGEACAQIKKCCDVLGIEPRKRETLQVSGAAQALQKEQIEALLGRDDLSSADLDILLESRNAMRVKKEFALADRIRGKLQEMGYEVRDDGRKGSRAVKR